MRNSWAELEQGERGEARGGQGKRGGREEGEGNGGRGEWAWEEDGNEEGQGTAMVGAGHTHPNVIRAQELPGRESNAGSHIA